MENQIEIVYSGNLRTSSKHILSNNSIITDAPLDNQGKGEAFSPTDLVASALGSCMLTIMGIAAKTQNIDIDGAHVKIQKIMGEDPRRISKIILDFTFIKPLNAKSQQLLERAAKHCPVSKSLDPNLEEIISFSYCD
tara:strand:+ start:97 stop:507 length:411 start_codon:yes stop_codon:yes gene_type:complete